MINIYNYIIQHRSKSKANLDLTKFIVKLKFYPDP